MKEPTRNGNYRSMARGTTGKGKGDRVLGGEPAGTVTYKGVDADELLAFVAQVVDHGDMVSFSRTSDGGCYAICIVANGERLKAYPKNPDEMLITFRDMCADMGY